MQEMNLVKKSGGTFPVDPLAANVILDISARSGSIVDAQGHVITNSGVTIDSTTVKYGPSMRFNGTGYMTIPNTDGSLWLPGDFCLDFWHFLISKTAPYPTLFGNYDTWPNSNGLQMFATHSGAPTSSYCTAIVGGFPNLVSPSAVVYGTWVHYAMERSSGIVRNYINGTLASSVATSSALYGSKSKIYIGAPSDNPTTGSLNGYFDRYRLTNVVRYGAPFTPGKF